MSRILALSLLLTITLTGVAGAQQTDADEEYVASMGREHAGDTPVASPLAAAPADGEVTSMTVAYADLGGTEVSGYLAKPARQAPKAGILVIHEWWGLNDNIRAMADKLAAQGWAALAVDLYEGEVAADRDGAMSIVRNAQANDERLEENLLQARAWLAEQGFGKVGVIGWCFGGGWSLRAAVGLGEQIDATVVYYGRLMTEAADLATLTSPVLGIFGAEDRGIPLDSVKAFEAAMNEAGKSATIHVYDGADHAFANPSGTRYQADAAEDAWQKTAAFLAEHLQ